MKRIVTLLLVLVMVFSIVACTNDTPETSDTASKGGTTSTIVTSGDASEGGDTSEVSDVSGTTEFPNPTIEPKPIEDREDPTTYGVVSNDSAAEEDTVLVWKIPGDIMEGVIDISLHPSMMFDELEGEGRAFAEITFWNSDDEAMSTIVFASNELCNEGTWYDVGIPKNSGVDATDYPDLAYATISIGFENMTGTIYVAGLSLATGGEFFWSRDFAYDFTLEDEHIDLDRSKNINEDTIGVYVTTVYNKKDNVGTNLAAQDGAEVYVDCYGDWLLTNDLSAYVGQYNGDLNDGQIGPDAMTFSPLWFGFHKNAGTVVENTTIDEITGDLGTLIIDLGSAKEFNRIRLHYWVKIENGNVRPPLLVRAHYSDDGQNWTAYNDLLFELELDDNGVPVPQIDWADTGIKNAVTARYVKIEYLSEHGPWHMVSEVEVISTQVD